MKFQVGGGGGYWVGWWVMWLSEREKIRRRIRRRRFLLPRIRRRRWDPRCLLRGETLLQGFIIRFQMSIVHSIQISIVFIIIFYLLWQSKASIMLTIFVNYQEKCFGILNKNCFISTAAHSAASKWNQRLCLRLKQKALTQFSPGVSQEYFEHSLGAPFKDKMTSNNYSNNHC